MLYKRWRPKTPQKLSASTPAGPRQIAPVHAGTVAIDRKDGIHWDGARTGEKEPAVLLLTGIGPNITTQVDENGKPIGTR